MANNIGSSSDVPKFNKYGQSLTILDDALKDANTTRKIGEDTIIKLDDNNDRLKSMYGTVGNIDDNLSKSSRLLRNIKLGMTKEKAMMSMIILLLSIIIITLLIIRFGLVGKSKS